MKLKPTGPIPYTGRKARKERRREGRSSSEERTEEGRVEERRERNKSTGLSTMANTCTYVGFLANLQVILNILLRGWA